MNKGIIFVIGAAAGSAVTYFAVKNKFKKQAEDEIAEIRDDYRKRAAEFAKNKPDILSYESATFDKDSTISEDLLRYALHPTSIKTEEAPIDPEAMSYFEELMNTDLEDPFYEKYNDLANDYKSEEKEEEMYKEPFMITEDEFNDRTNGYEKDSLTYYKDEVLARFDDDEIVDISDNIGYENIDKLTEEDGEIIHVRNPRTGIDYEITYDDRNYSEVTGIFINEYGYYDED